MPARNIHLSRWLLWIAHRFSQKVSHCFRRLRNAKKPVTPEIISYRGFGNIEQIQIMGRLVEHKSHTESTADDSWWKNMRAMFRRFTRVQIPEATVEVEFEGCQRTATTDQAGYFRCALPSSATVPTDRLWHSANVRVVTDPAHAEGETTERFLPASDTLPVLIPRSDSQFGVISDIDDTIMHSHATDLIRLAWLTFTHNARTRVPFEGVSAFYRALQRGHCETRQNPVFYVSSSAWNLFDMLVEFMEIHQIPKGPILLRDLGGNKQNFIRSGHEHKLEKIERIFASCPDLPFILIGDSGQQDPYLYRTVVRDFPGRVLAIYIRDVADKNRSKVLEIRDELRAAGVEMELVSDTEAAAIHAAEHGWIPESRISDVRQDIARDQDRQE
ncbi:App1 family protein [Thalassoroseus pseudoceratinae]|uniref:App1 family protein n=1 Tax=Thalassoroseus pseudoceratinae TaxID=2713176 RepID=UPI00141F8DC4|nr:phosphatase domain-containing protein [Thalassoroseus pseudoceratinae]